MSGLCECGCGERTTISPRSSTHHGWTKGEPRRFIKGHSMRGRAQPQEANIKRAVALRGRRHSSERRAAIKQGRALGKTPTLTPDSLSRRAESISRALRGVARPNQRGEKNHQWKGSAVGYATLHAWVARHKRRAGVCSRCGVAAKTEWANISGEYLRDLDDFVEMCLSCHRRYDFARRSQCV